MISKGDGHPPAGSSASRSGCSPGRLRGASMALRHRAPRSAPALPAPGPARRAGRERTAPVPPRSRLPPPGTRRLRKKSNTGPGGGAKMAPGTEGGRSGRECTGDGGHRGWGERAVGRIGGGEDGGWGGAAMGSAEDALGMGRTGKGSTGGLGRSGDGEKQGWGGQGMGRSGDGEKRGWGEAGMGRSGDGENRGCTGNGESQGRGWSGMLRSRTRGCSAAKLRCCRAPLPRSSRLCLRFGAALEAFGVRRNFPGARHRLEGGEGRGEPEAGAPGRAQRRAGSPGWG